MGLTMAVSVTAICPECGGERTIRKGVCFRCGYREKLPSASGQPKTAPAVPVEPVIATTPVQSVPVAPRPVLPYSPPKSASPSSTAVVGVKGTEGRITALGAPRTEVVALGPGDALARVTGRLAFALVMLLSIIALFPLIVVIVALSLVIPGLRGLMLSPWLVLRGRGAGRNGQDQRQEVEIPITPFTLTTTDGRRIEVILRGELQGGSPHLGDDVSVHGRIGRNGTIEARSVTNTATGAKTTTRRHPALVKARVKAILSIIALVGLCLLVYSLARTYIV